MLIFENLTSKLHDAASEAEARVPKFSLQRELNVFFKVIVLAQSHVNHVPYKTPKLPSSESVLRVPEEGHMSISQPRRILKANQ